MTAIPLPHPSDRPIAEIVRTRDDAGRPVWALDRLIRDERDGSVSRVEIGSRASLREILADALEFEKRGGFVRRGGLAR